jgi:predicted DNA-binding protein
MNNENEDHNEDQDFDGREKSFYAFRPFKDQLKNLEWLIVHKYHNNRTKADLIREAIDQYIEREKDR